MFLRRQQRLKRFRRCLREGLRDRDHIQHTNGTTATVPAVGTDNSTSPKSRRMPTSRTDNLPITPTFRFKRRRSSHIMWVLLNPFPGDKLTLEVFAKFYPEQSQRRQSYYNPQTTVPIPAAPVQQPPPPRTLPISPLSEPSLTEF